MKEIKLSRGKVAIVDDEDFERVNALTWHWVPADDTRARASRKTADAPGYASRRHKSLGKTTPMHRFILGLVDIDGNDSAPGIEVDHKDGNGLNNRRGNIRACTHAQNQHNRRPFAGKYKGVFRRKNKWRAMIRIDDRLIHLGTFYTEEMAAVAYNRAARSAWGEFAYLNPVPDMEPVRSREKGGNTRGWSSHSLKLSA